MHSVAQRIETGKYIQRDRRIGMPAVVLRNGHELCPGTWTIHAYSLCVRAKMAPTRKAIATMTTGDVTLTHNEIALSIAFHLIAHAIRNTDKFMPNGHRHRNRFLRPRVPIIDVDVR